MKIDEFISDELAEQLIENSLQRKSQYRGISKTVLKAAACVMFVVVLFNYRTVYAKTVEFISYVFGTGYVKSGDVIDYYAMYDPVTFGEKQEYEVQVAYYANKQIYIVLSKNDNVPLSKDDIKLKVGSKTYSNSVGNRGASVATAVMEGINNSDYISMEELIYDVDSYASNITLQVGDQEAALNLQSPKKYTKEDAIVSQTDDISLELLSLSSKNNRFAMSLKGTDKYQSFDLKLMSAEFINEKGETENAFEEMGGILKASRGINEYPFTRLQAEGIYMDYNTGGTPIECTLPVPVVGETLSLQQKITINGMNLVVEKITRSSKEIKLHIQGDPQYEELNNVSIMPVRDQDKIRLDIISHTKKGKDLIMTYTGIFDPEIEKLDFEILGVSLEKTMPIAVDLTQSAE